MCDECKWILPPAILLIAIGAIWWLVRKLRRLSEMRQIKAILRDLSRDLREHGASIGQTLPKKHPNRLWLELAEWLDRGSAYSTDALEALRYLLIRMYLNFFAERTTLFPVDERLTAILRAVLLSICFDDIPASKPSRSSGEAVANSMLEAEKALLAWGLCTGLYEINPLRSIENLVQLVHAELLKLVPQNPTPAEAGNTG